MSSAKPKLLIFTSTLPRWPRDTEPRFVLDLAKALSGRFEPVILAPMAMGCQRNGSLEGVRVERFRYAPARFEKLASPGAIMPNLRSNPFLYALVPAFVIGQVFALILLLRRERFDAIHCHWLVPQGLALAIAKLLVPVPPTLLTCHGADAFTLNFQPMPALKRWILRAVDGVTVVSAEIAGRIPARSARGPIHIPMGVDLRRFAKSKVEPRVDIPTILFVGRLAEKKGLDRLLRCVADHRLASLQAHLRVIGDGPLGPELRKLATHLGIVDRVEFVGSLPHEQLAREMLRADVFCAPFVIAPDGDREGTPTVLLEAAAAAIPIITTDVGGCGDIISHGHSGWLVKAGDEAALADAIIEALEDPARSRAMAGKARRRVEELSWPRIADRYADVLFAISAKAVA